MSSTPTNVTPTDATPAVPVPAVDAASAAVTVDKTLPLPPAPTAAPVVDANSASTTTLPPATPAPASPTPDAASAAGDAGSAVDAPHKINQTILDQFEQLKLYGNEVTIDALHRIQSKQSHLSAGILFSDPSLGIMKPIVDALMLDRHFDKPSQIQATTLPLILNKKNVIAQAQSGAGKTIAFSIGMLSTVDTRYPVTQALCLAPTREIAQHIFSELQSLATRLPIRLTLAIPGNDVQSCDSHVVVGTPGTVGNWIRSKVLNVQYVRIFVLDEADHMVDKETGAKTKQIKKALNPAVQTLFFSATYTPEVINLSQMIVPKAYLIRPETKEELMLDVIFQVRMDVNRIKGGKLQALKDVYDFLTVQQSIVFVEKKRDVDSIAALLQQAGFEISPIHGDLTHEQRDAVMNEFSHGRTKVLITTNVLARGIDVPSVAVVVNYDVPLKLINGKKLGDEVLYLHRIGRCGRFGRRGTAITFVETPEEMRMMDEIERFYSPNSRLTTDWDPNDIEELSAEIKKRPEGDGVDGNTGLSITIQDK